MIEMEMRLNDNVDPIRGQMDGIQGIVKGHQGVHVKIAEIRMIPFVVFGFDSRIHKYVFIAPSYVPHDEWP